jgi:hypothetical protein
MAQQATNVNGISGWLMIPESGCTRFLASKMEEDGNHARSLEFTTEELSNPVCMCHGPGEPTIMIKGPVEFEDGKTFDEPRGGWTLLKFKKMIGDYEFEKRLNPKNYFLGAIDRQHVSWAGIEIVKGVYKINWD